VTRAELQARQTEMRLRMTGSRALSTSPTRTGAYLRKHGWQIQPRRRTWCKNGWYLTAEDATRLERYCVLRGKELPHRNAVYGRELEELVAAAKGTAISNVRPVLFLEEARG
jgi:hypothetical protein